MNSLNKVWLTSLVAAGLISGCGGDGSSNPVVTPVAVNTVLTGSAVKGPISGTVCAYSLSSTGAIGTTALACSTSNPTTGAYSITLPAYVGNVLVKAFGTYRDEATGITKTITEVEAIRAMVACNTAGVACKAAVTPLTEVALRVAAAAAGGLTTANVEAAYLKVAQAYGLNPANTADSVSKLVATIPDFTSRTDAAATMYADLLAVVSQAQAINCGASPTCTIESYLAAVNTLLAGTSAATSLQSALAAAFSAWSSNALNTSGITCSLNSSGVASCALPAAPAVPSAPTGATTPPTGATGGTCSAGTTALVFGSNSGTTSTYTNGQTVCFTGSATSLSFLGTTLTNPTAGAPNPDFSIYTFADTAAGYKYEVVYRGAALALYEINLLSSTGAFLGQFAPPP